MTKYLRCRQGLSTSHVLCSYCPSCKTSYLLSVATLFGVNVFVAEQTVELWMGCITHYVTLPVLPSNPMWKSIQMCINKHYVTS